jgi:hypothetical protein
MLETLGFRFPLRTQTRQSPSLVIAGLVLGLL